MPERPGAEGPVCRIIAGPNGGGKTTFALRYLPRVAPGIAFVNADLIAAGLSPLAPERQLVANRTSFAFETTLSGRAYLRLVHRLKEAGWRVELLYLALPSVELSRQRVAERVAHGGHAVAPDDIERRFPRSLHNLLEVYAESVDEARCLLNSDPHPEMIFVQRGATRRVFNQRMYDHLVKEAHL